MPDFTVLEASQKKTVDGQHGPMQVIALKLQEYGLQPVAAEWFTKASTPLPAAGQKLEGTVEPGQYGPRFRKTPPAGAFGGRGRSPEETRAIVRQHSQAMALQYASIRQSQGELPAEKFTLENLWKLVDQFDADVARAKGRVEGQR